MLFGRRHSRQQQTRGYSHPRRAYFGRLFTLQAVQPVKVYGTGRALKSGTRPEFRCFRAQSKVTHRSRQRRTTSGNTRAAGKLTSERPNRNQTSSPQKENPTRHTPGRVFISRHSVREAAFKRDAVQSRVHQTSPTQHAIRRKLCAHSYCRLGAAFFNGLRDGVQQRPCTSQRPQQSPVQQE